MVLVLLGLAAAFILPSLRLPSRSVDQVSVLERARAIAVRRGEAVRLQFNAAGAWTVRSTADTLGTILLGGAESGRPGDAVSHSIIISALGACLPEGTAAVGTPAWDPARCAEARH